MPSPLQVQGSCNFAPAFRSGIWDIYNSSTGLTLQDVAGIDGWALSKRHNAQPRLSHDGMQEVYELLPPWSQ
jgi:hypothetical protein